MNRFNQLLIIMVMMLAISGTVRAQDDIDYEQQTAALRWYADRAEEIITRFEGMRHDSGQLPQKFCAFPYKQAGNLGFALVVATWDERELIMFTPNGNTVKAQNITRNALPDELYWSAISNLCQYVTPSLDITLCQRPLPVRQPDKNGNKFLVVLDGEDKVDITGYDQMIFKPHHNPVRLAEKHPVMETDPDGTIIKDQMQYVFSLKTPSVVAKMFRGYDNEEMTPWIVKSDFFAGHTLLQYSKWKEGEPVRKASRDVLRAISNYYGGRQIKESQWLATLESDDRSFYAVQFEHKGSDALAGLVCMANGQVVSVWEFHGNVDPATYHEGESVWFVDDDGEFMPHAPEINCIVATECGLELYVRLFGGESVQYYILREIGPVWMEFHTLYWVWVWD